MTLPKSPTFLGNYCKGAKIIHFSNEIIFGQLLQTFGDFYLVTLLAGEKFNCKNHNKLSVYKKHFCFRRSNKTSQLIVVPPTHRCFSPARQKNIVRFLNAEFPKKEKMVQGIFDQGFFDHGFFGHWLKMPPAGLGDGQKTVLGGHRQVRLAQQ